MNKNGTTITMSLVDYEDMKTELSAIRTFKTEESVCLVYEGYTHYKLIYIKDNRSVFMDLQNEIDRLKKRNLFQRIFNL